MSPRFSALSDVIEHSPNGSLPDPLPSPGDIILCHRRGFVSWLIRLGEGRHSRWSHVVCCLGGLKIVEALTKGVVENSLMDYHDIEFVLIRIRSSSEDAAQVVAFWESCIGQRYGWGTIFRIALRILNPIERKLNGTEICSGMAAQGLVRGWANFPRSPDAITPEGLGDFYQVDS